MGTTKKKKGIKNPSVEQLEEWNHIEDLVMTYKMQFDEENVSEEELEMCKQCADEIIKRFYPIMRKYLILLRGGSIDFLDPEMKAFIRLFMDDKRLMHALDRQKQKSEFKTQIYKQFEFVRKTYGKQEEADIMTDLQMLVLGMAKRYKKTDRNFCGYLYNSFRFEVFRHIGRYLKNPLNIDYKLVEYDDEFINEIDESASLFENLEPENELGIPDLNWINGKDCSEIFSILTPLERKLLVKYYLEEWNDKQIAEEYGLHINTVNNYRRTAVNKVAKHLGIDEVKRSRRSGKNAIINI